MRVAEAEFAFRLKRSLPARERVYGVQEVLDAVESLHPAIEIPDSRYDDFAGVGAPQLIADMRLRLLAGRRRGGRRPTGASWISPRTRSTRLSTASPAQTVSAPTSCAIRGWR